jgi:hypothetical protein
MDPASAFALAVGAMQATEQAAKVCSCLLEYFRIVKQAPNRSRELRDEARLVSDVLDDLKSFLEESKSTSVPEKDLSVSLRSTVKEFTDMMDEMAKRVEVKKEEVYKRFKWPFTQKENKEYLERLGRYKSTFTVALGTISSFDSTPLHLR